MNPCSMNEVVDGRRYNTDTAELLAGNDYWDGHNFERQGTNCFLYRTPKGAYFTLSLSQWEGSTTTIEPVSEAAAREHFEDMREKRVDYEKAFPDFVVEDA